MIKSMVYAWLIFAYMSDTWLRRKFNKFNKAQADQYVSAAEWDL